MTEGESVEGGSGGGFMKSWRERFIEFLRTSPSQQGERRGPAPVAPLQRTETNTPLQDIRDKKI